MSDNKIIPINQNNEAEEEGLGIMNSPILATIIEQAKPILQKIAIPLGGPALNEAKNYLKGTEKKNPTGIKKYILVQVDEKTDNVILCVLDKSKTEVKAPRDAVQFIKSIDNPKEIIEQAMKIMGLNQEEDEKK